MPLVLSVGLTKKLGLPAFSTVGASCNVQVEVDSRILEHGPEAFHQQVQEAFTACREAVQHELDRHLPPSSRDTVASPGDNEGPAESAAEEEETSSVGSNSQGHNGEDRTDGRLATRRQLEYLRQLAGQIHELGIRRLEGFASDLIGKPLAGLSSHDASRLIDALKAVKAGRLTLADLTKEAEG